MFQNLTGWHALILLAVVLLIFGAAKLPALARSVGQSMRILKDETRAGNTETATADSADSRSAHQVSEAPGTRTPVVRPVSEASGS